ncbi:PAS domain-containing sensor histidine kinase [Magnetospira sp. QH-2]|uniref:sensor histidine kinase NtrY-like n=1 Tax=Magnetospira sp. (strain QH-2) TaxID=1288970 RepID=UPI0003E81BBD|nr:PAS domain-containing sensor histidine kinase [Magnetospira sp. QH-2]CCQ73802.1 Nitrogen regulation protein ntrY [Magnetospira sp. QH-2]
MNWRRKWRRLLAWTRRTHLSRKLTIVLVVASVISGLATFATMSGTATIYGPDTGTVIALLYLDVVLLLLLGAVVARPLTRVWVARRRGRAGSRLHVRLVMMFSLVAVLPAVVVAVFTAVFLNFGIQAWFGERVATVVDNSRAVAHAYLEEHRKSIRAEILAMANDINRDAGKLAASKVRFNRYLETQSLLRSLSEAVIIDGTGKVLARTALSLSLSLENIPREALRQADQGKVVLQTTGQDDRVRAMVALERLVNAYLLVGRFVDQEVVTHIERTEGAYREYKAVEKRRESMQITFILIFVVLALLLLMASIRVGLTLASSLVQPISGLIGASERIRHGDLTARADVSSSADEIGTLGRVFNRMALQLENQQRGLLEANRELDERRRFTETVLAGVSAGVIGLDTEGRISLSNRSAGHLLAQDLNSAIGKPLVETVPEMADLYAEACLRPDRTRQDQIKVMAEDRQRTFLVRVAAETLGESILGYVVTFDDITDLQHAQRQAAWSDVARRIAHEIKNPLTPIQLSAERLKRKYLKQIEADPEIFTMCTDTIVRQVKDIGRLVDEFSSFARMPEPTMKEEDLGQLARNTVFLERSRGEHIRFELAIPDEPVSIRCDPHQIRQALTNILKNAAEALTENPVADKDALIEVRLSRHEEGKNDQGLVLEVLDNGPGLPSDQKDRLTDPYVTTRPTGTGLGLAIVRKIMEDHGGELLLNNRDEGGARASLVFPPSSDRLLRNVPDDDSVDPMTVAVRLTTHGP